MPASTEVVLIEEMIGKVYHTVSVDSLTSPCDLTFRGYNHKVLFYHEQDCCETVTITQIDGDIKALVGSPIKMAEVVTNESRSDCQTWTFLKLATDKGYVTVRWLGESNGYSSERISWHVTEGEGSDR